MNWDRDRWTPEESQGSYGNEFGENYIYSNIRHTWGEQINTAPFAGTYFNFNL